MKQQFIMGTCQYLSQSQSTLYHLMFYSYGTVENTAVHQGFAVHRESTGTRTLENTHWECSMDIPSTYLQLDFRVCEFTMNPPPRQSLTYLFKISMIYDSVHFHHHENLASKYISSKKLKYPATTTPNQTILEVWDEGLLGLPHVPSSPRE